jgi:hypothetical protein
MKIAPILFLFFFGIQNLSAQFWNDAGDTMKGKIRIVKDSIHIPGNHSDGSAENIRFRAFSVDSVNPYSTFGNHYVHLQKVIGKDPVPAVYLLNAVYWEKTQRYFIGGAFAFGFATLFYGSLLSTTPQGINTLLYCDLGVAGGLLTTYLFKRHWANKSIRTWNKDLEEGKYIY